MTSEAVEALRKLLVERRAALGYSQRKLGERMGTAQSNVSALELGTTESPGIDVLVRWVEALHGKLTFQVELEAVVIAPRSLSFPFGPPTAEPPPYTEEEYAELARRHRENGGRVPTPEERRTTG